MDCQKHGGWESIGRVFVVNGPIRAPGIEAVRGAKRYGELDFCMGGVLTLWWFFCAVRVGDFGSAEFGSENEVRGIWVSEKVGELYYLS